MCCISVRHWLSHNSDRDMCCVSVAHWLSHNYDSDVCCFSCTLTVLPLLTLTHDVCFSCTRMWWWNCLRGASCCLASSASSSSQKWRPWTLWTSWCELSTSCTARVLCIAISNLRLVLCPCLPASLLYVSCFLWSFPLLQYFPSFMSVYLNKKYISQLEKNQWAFFFFFCIISFPFYLLWV